jgi:hypothetical protein
MKSPNALLTHSWTKGLPPRQILQDGRTLLHHHCNRCGRDFGFELDGSGWHAIYVGVFRVEVLVENVSRRWVTDMCPGRLLPSDDIDRVLRTSSPAAA